MTPWRLLPVLVAASLLAGCLGGDDPGPAAGKSKRLSIYMSLPQRGPSADEAAAVEAGARLALADAGARVGRRRLRLVVLDSTDGEGGIWRPDRVQANAERASEDPSAVAYLGELDFGASAVSVPVTNEAELLQVSPGDGLTSLTRAPPGRAGRGAPERYYPSGRRNFVRVVPNDLLQADMMIARLGELGSGRVVIVSGEGVYAEELSSQLAQRARRDGLQLLASETLRGQEEGAAASLVAELKERRPDVVILVAVGDGAAVGLLRELSTRLPATRVLATSGLLARRPRSFPASPAQVELLSPVRPPSSYPAPASSVLRRAGSQPRRSEALYGYEAMSLAIDAVKAGGGERAAVMRQGLKVRTRRSVLGRYEVRASGDVSEERFALYRLERGRFRFAGPAR